MRIKVDIELCQGHGRCYMLAPNLFEPDDEGYCTPTSEQNVPEEFADEAQKAIANCPENAILVVGS